MARRGGIGSFSLLTWWVVVAAMIAEPAAAGLRRSSPLCWIGMGAGLNGKFSGEGSSRPFMPTTGAANSTIQKLQEDLRRLQEDLDQIEKGEEVDYYGARDRQVSRGRNGGILTAGDVVDAQGVSAGTSVPIGLRYMPGMPGAGVYGEETEDGYILLGNAPYGKPQRPKSDVFCGIGWGYGFGCAIGPFFGTGAGISLFPPGPVHGAGGGCGLICGVGLCSGVMLGIGNAFVAYGFNEPLTITQRFYRQEQIAEELTINVLKFVEKKKQQVKRAIVNRKRSIALNLQNQLVAATGWKDAQKGKPVIERFAGVDGALPRRDARGSAEAGGGVDSGSHGRSLTAAGYLQSLKEHREWVSEEAQSMKVRAKRAKAGEDFASMEGDSRLPKVNPLHLLDDDDQSAEGMLKKRLKPVKELENDWAHKDKHKTASAVTGASKIGAFPKIDPGPWGACQSWLQGRKGAVTMLAGVATAALAMSSSGGGGGGGLGAERGGDLGGVGRGGGVERGAVDDEGPRGAGGCFGCCFGPRGS